MDMQPGKRNLVRYGKPLIFLLFAVWLWTLPTSSWAKPPLSEETEVSLEEVVGTFDEDGTLHNETEKAYSLPDIGIFTAFFPDSGDLATGLSIELYDRRYRRGLLSLFKYDLQVSEQRLGISIGRKLIPVIDFTVGVSISRDFDRDETTAGISFSIVKF